MFTFRLLVFSTIVTLILLTPALAPIFAPLGPHDVEESRAGLIISSLVLVHHLGR